MNTTPYEPAFRYIHFFLIIFGLASYFTGELAEEYEPIGFWIHSGLGFVLALAIIVRIIYGFSGSEQLGFASWGRKIRDYRNTVVDDLKIIFGLALPDRDLHEGIAGVVQLFGLVVFGWMSVTGIMIFLIELHYVGLDEELFEELHEFGEVLIPVFLIMHIGAVILHYLKGDKLLVKINPFRS